MSKETGGPAFPAPERSVTEIIEDCYEDGSLSTMRVVEALTLERNARVEVEKKLVCSECGGTDIVCAKGWWKERDEIRAKLSKALKVVEAASGMKKVSERIALGVEEDSAYHKHLNDLFEALHAFDEVSK